MKTNARETVQKLIAGRMDPSSTGAWEVIAELEERILKDVPAEDRPAPNAKGQTAGS